MGEGEKGPGGPDRLAGWMVAAAALLVPRRRRDGWLEEWRSELWHAARTASGSGRTEQLRLAAGAVPDALALRRIERERNVGRSPTEGMTRMWNELKVAARSLLRAPGFTVAAVVTLGIGIGGATAIYTLLDRVVLDPLPYPGSDELVRLRNQVPGVGPGERWHLSTGQYVLYGSDARTIGSLGVWQTGGANLSTPSGPRRVRMAVVSAEMVDILGLKARRGRLIDPADDRPDAPPVVLLSEGFWTRSFGGDPSVVGRTLDLNGEAVEVVGVVEGSPSTPAGLSGATTRPPDLWLPIRIDPAGPHWNSHVYSAVARIPPDVTPREVERELASLQPRLVERFPDAYHQSFFDRYGFRQTVTPLKEDVVGDMARHLWILGGAVALVLAVAFANVANLVLARMEERRRELGVRVALGAGRRAIVLHVLAESLVLGAAGGAVAVGAAWWSLSALVPAAPEGLPRLDSVGLGPESVLFAGLLSVGLAAALSLVSLVRERGATGTGRLGGARGASAGRERQRLRGALIVTQVALALTLTVGAGLLVESMRQLRSTDPGFDPAGVLVAELHLTPGDYPREPEVWSYLDRALERIRAIPGVVAAGASPDIPLTGGYGCTVQGFEDPAVYRRMEESGRTTCAGQQQTTPGYFEAMGIEVVEGRAFTDADNDSPDRGVAVVSREYAERFWPGEEAIGKGIAPSGMTGGPFYRVVGVVEDVNAASMAEEPAAVVHYPVRPIPETRFRWPGSQTLVVRSEADDPLSVFTAVREALRAIDPAVPVANVRTMEEVVEGSMARISFVSLLLEVAALVALGLAAVGLYGVISYLVSRRTREIGMRLAIGAEPATVQWEIVRRSLVLTATGLAAGALLAFLTAGVLEGLLYGVEPAHPVVFTGAGLVLAAVATVAAWIPARRAAGVDPSVALRAE